MDEVNVMECLYMKQINGEMEIAEYFDVVTCESKGENLNGLIYKKLDNSIKPIKSYQKMTRSIHIH